MLVNMKVRLLDEDDFLAADQLNWGTANETDKTHSKGNSAINLRLWYLNKILINN